MCASRAGNCHRRRCRNLDFHPAAVDHRGDRHKPLMVDDGGHFFGRGEAGVIQEQGHPIDPRQIDRTVALDETARGYAAHGGMVYQLGVRARTSRIPSNHHRALGCCIDLPIGRVERRQQQQSAFETASVSHAEKP